MSEAIEAVRGAVALVFAGFFLLVFGQAVAGTALDTGVVNISLLGVLAITGAAIVIVAAVVALLRNPSNNHASHRFTRVRRPSGTSE